MTSESKTFFKKLTALCRELDDAVTDIEKKVHDYTPDTKNEELAAEKVAAYRDVIKRMTVEATALRSFLASQNAQTDQFLQNFKELIVELESKVAQKEEYLKQYGYKLLESAAVISPEDGMISPVKESCEDTKHAATPTLLDYGIVPLRNQKSVEGSAARFTLNSDKEKSDSTPTLEVSQMPEMKEETPPMPTSLLPTVYEFPRTPTLEL